MPSFLLYKTIVKNEGNFGFWRNITMSQKFIAIWKKNWIVF
jgi:hypothetical protein